MKRLSRQGVLSPLRSLTTRVTLLGVGLMLLALVALGLYAGQRQRLDMEHQLGAQQYSTATFIAANLDREFELRIDALQKIAEPITTAMLADPPELRRLMAERPVFQGYFNAGTYVANMLGKPLSTVAGPGGNPDSMLADSERMAAWLQTAQPHGVFLSQGQTDEIRIAVPIRHQGRTIGALVGVNRLSLPNFLDTIAQNRYGQSGFYVLVAVPQRTVVLASAFANAGARAGAQSSGAQSALVTADMLKQADGTYLAQATDGQDLLVSSRTLATANWSMSVLLPTAEAFAIVADQQQRLWLFTLGFAAFLGWAAWWILRQQFSPIRGTVEALDRMAQPGQTPHALATTGQQETDSLIAGFNTLLSVLAERSAALQASFALNQNTLDSLAAHIAVVDAQGTLLAVNKPWSHDLSSAGWRMPADAPDGPDAPGFAKLFAAERYDHEDAHAAILAGIQSVLRHSQNSYSKEYAVRTDHGTRWLALSVTPLDGPKRGAVLSRSDITQRKEADERLRKLSRIADQAPLAVLITDLRGNIEYANPCFTDMTGYTVPEVLGLNPRIFQSGKTAAATYQELWASLRAGKVWRGVFANQRKDGSPLVERAVVAPVIDAAGVVTHYVALKEDITESQRQEQRREALSLRIEELSRRLVRVQEESRSRFSQELHDRTSPNLAALRINLDIIAQSLEPQALGASVFDRLEDTRVLIDDTTLSIREICAGLHPAAIERGGLLGVVRAYCEQFSRRTGMAVELRCPHDEKRLSADLEVALFRIIQEALANCAKHANARAVEVRLQFDKSPVIVSISDDGCGFDAAAALGGSTLRGLGLVNMRDTVDFAGGRMRLDSSPGAGTRIYIEI